jgi:hypothetical protein
MLFGKVRSAVRLEDDCARVVREVRAAFEREPRIRRD